VLVLRIEAFSCGCNAHACAPRSNAPAIAAMSLTGNCSAAAKATAAKETTGIKPAQNIALLCAHTSRHLNLVGAKSTVQIT